MSLLLETRRLAWRAGDVSILDNVNLKVAAGEFVALMGRNGAGKSTLLDVIAGVRAPSHGEIWIDGSAAGGRDALERARIVSHLPQTTRSDLSMTALQFVLMGRYPHATGWFESEEDLAVARWAMKECDCLAFRDRRLSTLSGGERQRVLLATCLAQRPMLLLLDEPATFLDVDQQVHCFTVLRRQADEGAACLAVTHDINLALTFCTRILVLSDGAIAYDVDCAHAIDDDGWLALFSPRLEIMNANGRSWVCIR